MAKTGINLLPQEEFDASILGRILKWAMGTFRIIVIVTEMIVMGAFLSRFWLDAQNADLAESIKIKSSEISAQSEFEKEFRDIQSKLNIVKSLSAETKLSDRINLIASKTPSDITLSSVSVQNNTASIRGAAASEISVAQFLSNLKNEKTFKKVELGSLNSSENNANLTLFTINISY